MTVVDTLEEANFQARHLPGAINIPARSGGFVERVQIRIPDKGTRVILYDAGPESILSGEAARKLEAAGYGNVCDFAGGVTDWQDAGYTFESAFGTVRMPVGVLSEA